MKSIVVDNGAFGAYVGALYESAKKTEPVIGVISTAVADMVLSAACLIDNFTENKADIDEESLIIPKGFVISLNIAKAIHQKNMWALFSLFHKGADLKGLDMFLKQVMPFDEEDEVLLRASYEEGKGNFLLNVATALNSSVYKLVNEKDYPKNIVSDFVTSTLLSHYVQEAKKVVTGPRPE